jgi:ribosomal protein S20
MSKETEDIERVEQKSQATAKEKVDIFAEINEFYGHKFRTKFGKLTSEAMSRTMSTFRVDPLAFNMIEKIMEYGRGKYWSKSDLVRHCFLIGLCIEFPRLFHETGEPNKSELRNLMCNFLSMNEIENRMNYLDIVDKEADRLDDAQRKGLITHDEIIKAKEELIKNAPDGISREAVKRKLQGGY